MNRRLLLRGTALAAALRPPLEVVFFNEGGVGNVIATASLLTQPNPSACG